MNNASKSDLMPVKIEEFINTHRYDTNNPEIWLHNEIESDAVEAFEEKIGVNYSLSMNRCPWFRVVPPKLAFKRDALTGP